MIKKLIHHYLIKKHYWRHVDFDELAELYTSILLRSLSINLVGVFVPVYLYQIGYELRQIFLFFLVFFVFRLFADFGSAFFVARFGPKHTIALSTIIRVIDMIFLLTLEEYHWPLALLACISTTGYSLFFTAYHTEFSKIKHSKHAGKEIGSVAILDRLGGVLGPLIGGVIAAIWGAHLVLIIALVMLLFSLVPLLLSGEVVRTKQNITFRGFRFKKHIRTYVAGSGFSLDNTVSLVAWPMFVGIIIFGGDNFAKLGAVTSISTITALVSIKGIGKLIDAKKGWLLYRYAVIINAGLHMLRPFVMTTKGVFATNAANDPTTAAFRMSFLKAYYDAADREPGYRIVFLTMFEVMTTIPKVLFWLTLYIMSFWYDSGELLRWSFLPAGLITLIMLYCNLPSLKRRVQ